MGAIKHYIYIGEHMITNQDKIDIIDNRLDTLEFIINSFIDALRASAFRNDGNKFYKTHRILVLIDDGDQSSSFVRDVAFSLAA